MEKCYIFVPNPTIQSLSKIAVAFNHSSPGMKGFLSTIKLQQCWHALRKGLTSVYLTKIGYNLSRIGNYFPI